MSLEPSVVKTAYYDKVQVVLHWLIAVMIIAMIAIGLYMTSLPKISELPPGSESVRQFWFELHKSLGISVALLIVIRIFWRVSHPAPALPEAIPTWQQKLSKLGHMGLYFLMVFVPLTGFISSAFGKYPVKFWGIDLPRLAEADHALRHFYKEMHELGEQVLIILLVVHLLAVIWHHVDGVKILQRMSIKR